MPAHPSLFADIDSMDPDAFAKHLAVDVSFKFGNSDPVIGRDSVRDTWAGFCEGIDGVSHEVIEQWNEAAATIVESTVTYTRKDSSTVSLPDCTGRCRPSQRFACRRNCSIMRGEKSRG